MTGRQELSVCVRVCVCVCVWVGVGVCGCMEGREKVVVNS